MKTDGEGSEHIGKRVLIQGDHPSAGRAGVYKGMIETPYGERPVVEVDGMGGHRVTIMHPDQWQSLE